MLSRQKASSRSLLKTYPLIDITIIPDDELRTHKGIAILELIQKNIHKRDALEFIKDIALQVAKHLLTPDQFNSLLYYISQEGESKNFEKFYSTLAEALPNFREDIMTLAQQLEQKGIEVGEHRKAMAIAKVLLAEGKSPGSVQKLTGLSEKEIMALVDKH